MYWGTSALNAEYPFSAVYFHPGPATISLFPLVGPESKIALPGRSASFRVLGFSPDGKAAYGVNVEPPNPSDGITKIEFRPTRQSRVPGSVGFGGISYLTASQSSSRIFVTGWIGSRKTPECGAFEVDPDAGKLRPLLSAASGGCGGAIGPVSPNGRLVASPSGKQLSVLDLETRAVHVVKRRQRRRLCRRDESCSVLTNSWNARSAR
jgi:hypothetical protein